MITYRAEVRGVYVLSYVFRLFLWLAESGAIFTCTLVTAKTTFSGVQYCLWGEQIWGVSTHGCLCCFIRFRRPWPLANKSWPVYLWFKDAIILPVGIPDLSPGENTMLSANTEAIQFLFWAGLAMKLLTTNRILIFLLQLWSCVWLSLLYVEALCCFEAKYHWILSFTIVKAVFLFRLMQNMQGIYNKQWQKKLAEMCVTIFPGNVKKTLLFDLRKFDVNLKSEWVCMTWSIKWFCIIPVV